MEMQQNVRDLCVITRIINLLKSLQNTENIANFTPLSASETKKLSALGDQLRTQLRETLYLDLRYLRSVCSLSIPTFQYLRGL